ncbi:MAG: hypothetical protein B0A82_25640 [Alkalinema sp. CACIAM 70d]|nr:MAG: hypothetical protein B0A82_25640 [Alkalinema sp. CACIAM 70d]
MPTIPASPPKNRYLNDLLLTLFNLTTWQKFLNAGATVAGFPKTRWETMQQILRTSSIPTGA